MFQVGEAAEAAKKIGLEPVIILIIVLPLVALMGVIVKWFMRVIDRKDQDMRQLETARREDLKFLEEALRETARDQRAAAADQRQANAEVVQSLRDLTREMRERR